MLFVVKRRAGPSWTVAWRFGRLVDATVGPVRDRLCRGLEESRAAVADRIATELWLGRHLDLIDELVGLAPAPALRDVAAAVLPHGSRPAGPAGGTLPCCP